MVAVQVNPATNQNQNKNGRRWPLTYQVLGWPAGMENPAVLSWLKVTPYLPVVELTGRSGEARLVELVEGDTLHT